MSGCTCGCENGPLAYASVPTAIRNEVRSPTISEAVLKDLATLRDRAAQAVNRLADLNDRTTGSVPRPPKDSAPNGASGFFGEVSAHMAHLRSLMEELHDELARSEQAF